MTADLLRELEDETVTRVSVLLAMPFDTAFTYMASREEGLQPGDIVCVPFGRREAWGVVWDDLVDEELETRRLKWVLKRADAPPVPESQRRFIDWVADYTVSMKGSVLRMALSVPSALEPPRPQRVLRRRNDSDPDLRLTPARRRVLEVMEDNFARPATDLAREAGVGTSVLKGLVDAEVLEWASLPEARLFETPDWQKEGVALTEKQIRSAETLRSKIGQGFSAVLLDGVTGSGKTEVYFEAMAEALAQGRQVLVLLPEIALSAQWLARFERRFGVAPALWHSELTTALRRKTWRAVTRGEAKVLVGARSGLFLPFPDLGLIVVDEEHEVAFKQEDGVNYHARDMAVVQAHLKDIPILLASATPSLESVMNAENGKYQKLHLPDRYGGARLPEVELIDLRAHSPEPVPDLGPGWLAPPLRKAMKETLAANQQVLLFINRRGYAPLTLCRTCGHRMQCSQCTAWLVEHRFRKRLQCHHCGYSMPTPSRCPECESEESLVACGPGVERLAEEVAKLFPDSRRALLSSDTLTGPEAAAELFDQIGRHEVDLIIGTQIVAKGHHFPKLTLVGVVDVDLGLAGGDLRALERSYQLLHQVSGRAGRAELAGRVMLQTRDPDHPVMQALASGDRDAFMEREAEARRMGRLPPFARLAALILSDPEAQRADVLAREIIQVAPRLEGLEILGPAEAPLALLRGRHRRRFLIRARRDLPLQRILRDWLASIKVPNSSRLSIDIDPYSFL